MTEVKATFSSNGISTMEFASGLMGTHSDYILSSSSSTVDPEQLREKWLSLRAKEASTGREEMRDSLAFEPGRGQVCNVSMNDQEFVLRKYRRGGLVAKIAQASYVWTGLRSSRAYRELDLLDALHKQQVPVCRPEAAWIIRRGMVYQAYLMTERVPDARTLGQFFAADSLSETMMKNAGALIRRMHNANVWHADLNAHNILVSDQQCVLIDFDRGRARDDGGNWRQANLQRLQRSFQKLSKQHSVVLSDALWQTLLDAYEALNANTLEP